MSATDKAAPARRRPASSAVAVGQPIRIDALHPTQLSIGFRSAIRRAGKIADLSEAKLAAYLQKKAVPHVVGPGDRLYLTDHHHLCFALLIAKHDTVVVGERLFDWSDVGATEFWLRMRDQRLCWPIDADGILRPFAQIPDQIGQLEDSPWRSLAREVRDRAYADDDTPFQEFMWGDYFRTFMSRRLIHTDWDSAVDLAIRVAKLADAQDLPGYLGKAAGDPSVRKRRDRLDEDD